MKKKNLLKILVLSMVSVLIFTSCSDDNKEAIIKKESNSITSYKTPKYIFFFIGDGMSNPQINITEAALNSPSFTLKNSLKSVGIGELNMRKFTVVGMQTTHAEDRYITGSAAAGTALATGYKTTIGTISQDGTHTKNYKTMAEMAKAKGMKVGIVSSVSIDHATPACFYAHTNKRSNYYTIGQQLTKSNFDYFAGGGVRWNKYDDEGKTEDINLFLNAAANKGYTYINTKAAFDALTPASGKIIATLKQFYTNVSTNSAALPYVIDLDEQTSDNNKITLSEFTEKGIELLNNEKGFFMMVEGGKIDWACHANDVVTSAHNTIEFDKAIAKALKFYNKHREETLIIITGDHECGGLTIGYANTGYSTAFELLNHQTTSYEIFTGIVKSWNPATKTFASALADVKTTFGLGNATISPDLKLSTYEQGLLEEAFNLSMKKINMSKAEKKRKYGGYDPFTVTVTHILNNKAGIDWTSHKHTASPVPVFALGQGMYEFSGYYDNTDIAKKIIKIGKLNK
jgi:alkaline phosphatase